MAEGRISSGTIVHCAVALAARKQIVIGMMMIKKFPAVEEASPVPPPTSSPFSVTGNAAGAWQKGFFPVHTHRKQHVRHMDPDGPVGGTLWHHAKVRFAPVPASLVLG